MAESCWFSQAPLETTDSLRLGYYVNRWTERLRHISGFDLEIQSLEAEQMQ